MTTTDERRERVGRFTLPDRRILVALSCLICLLLIAMAGWDRLSARLTGEEVRLAVRPVDPIDPFRGAYVTLAYPGSNVPDAQTGESVTTGVGGTAYVTLVERGGLWEAGGVSRTKPGSGTFLACEDNGWRLACGIESYFLPQDKAAALEEDLRSGHAVAVVRVDGDGNAALVDIEAP